MSLSKCLHFHLRLQRWVVWWFYVGIVCGVIALANILSRQLSEAQIKVLLAFGVLHWLLGGVICYCVEGVKLVPPRDQAVQPPSPGAPPDAEWHSASDFLLPGTHKSILPPGYWRSRMTGGNTRFPTSGSAPPHVALEPVVASQTPALDDGNPMVRPAPLIRDPHTARTVVAQRPSQEEAHIGSGIEARWVMPSER